jgi:hypothetical protein
LLNCFDPERSFAIPAGAATPIKNQMKSGAAVNNAAKVSNPDPERYQDRVALNSRDVTISSNFTVDEVFIKQRVSYYFRVELWEFRNCKSSTYGPGGWSA